MNFNLLHFVMCLFHCRYYYFRTHKCMIYQLTAHHTAVTTQFNHTYLATNTYTAQRFMTRIRHDLCFGFTQYDILLSYKG